ncbi:MAG: MerR family transcriptional regulator [Bacteroidales bacterium]|jgi:DNA-binding transcriptional MerR regulator|nr:MerR family transcriptional regulator [Bacteroidales bacterium]
MENTELENEEIEIAENAENTQYDLQKLDKLFYTIGEVAKMFDVNASLIRYWEKEFTIIKPKKNAKGNRLFTKKDIENFHKIYYLVKERGMTLEGAKQHLKNSAGKNDANFEIVKTLKSIKSMILDLKNSLEEKKDGISEK